MSAREALTLLPDPKKLHCCPWISPWILRESSAPPESSEPVIYIYTGQFPWNQDQPISGHAQARRTPCREKSEKATVRKPGFGAGTSKYPPPRLPSLGRLWYLPSPHQTKLPQMVVRVSEIYR